jgi:acyl transferase domain-containing protein
MQNLPKSGSMAAVFTEEGRVASAIADQPLLSIASVNSERNIVVSGDSAALDTALAQLAESGVRSRRLSVSHAFHSPLMEPMLAEFKTAAARVRFSPPTIPVVSSYTGKLAPAGLMQQADYWARQTRGAVRFNDALRTLRKLRYEVLLEVGPGTTLMTIGKSAAPDATWLASLRRGRDDHDHMLENLAELYVRGASVDWSGFDAPFPRQRVSALLSV